MRKSPLKTSRIPLSLKLTVRSSLARFIPLICLAALLCSSGAVFAQFGKNKVQYKNFPWQLMKTEHFDIYFYEKERPMVLDAARLSERAFTRYSKILNFRPNRRIPLILYASHSDFAQTNVLPEDIEEGLAGVNEFAKKRVLLPFTGSWKDFEHVLTHELAHAFQIDILWGSNTPISNPFAFSPPLWFIEGMVEQLSLGGMTANHEMWLRDSALSGYLMTLQDLSYMPQGAYTFGHSFWYFISERYGSRKIGEILQKTPLYGNLDHAFKSAVGANMETLSKQWNEDIRKTYLPQIVNFEKPEDFSRRLTNHEKDGSSFNTTPALNSSGELLAFITNKSGYIDIFCASAIDGKKSHRLIGGQRNPSLEDIRFLFTSLDWSPDDRFLTFVGKDGPQDAIYVYSYFKHEVVKKFTFGLDGILTPDFSPDGKKIVFSGIDGGRSNLYLVDVDSGKLTQLTDDKYTQRDPDFSPDGEKIAFTTEYGPGTDFDRLIFADYRIGILDLRTGKYDVLPDCYGNNISPKWSPEGDKLAFISDRTGIPNIFYFDFKDSLDYQVTNILTGVSGIVETSPCLSWSSGSGRLAFSAFYNSGWDIFVLNNLERMAKPWKPDTSKVFDYQSVYLNASKERMEHLKQQLRLMPYPPGSAPVMAAGAASQARTESRPEAAGLAALTLAKEESGAKHPVSIDPASELSSPWRNHDLEETPPETESVRDLPMIDAEKPGAAVRDSAFGLPDSALAGSQLLMEDRPVAASSRPELGKPLDPRELEEWEDSAKVEHPDSLLAEGTDSLLKSVKGDSLPAISFDFDVPKEKIPLPDTSTFTYHKYKAKFSADYVSGYGGYTGNIGVSGGAYVSLSDQLGNHNIAIGANIYGKIQDSDLLFQYMNLKHRTDMGFYVTQFRDLYYLSSSYYGGTALANIWRGAGVVFSRPFNRFRRFEWGLSAYSVSQKTIDLSFDPYYYYFRENTIQEYGTSYFAGPQVALVYDNSAYGMTGPVDGERYRLSAQQFFGQLSYSEVMLDWRKYWLFWKRMSFAVRGIGAMRWGENPRLFYIGGPYTFRGASWGDLFGTNVLLTNAEIRFPLIDYLVMGWPLPVFLRGIGGVLFYDVAGAWSPRLDSYGYPGETFQPFTTKNSKFFRLKDAQAAYGFGVRMNLSYLILRMDFAKTLEHYDTNYYQVGNFVFRSEELVEARRRSFFSIGYDF